MPKKALVSIAVLTTALLVWWVGFGGPATGSDSPPPPRIIDGSASPELDPSARTVDEVPVSVSTSPGFEARRLGRTESVPAPEIEVRLRGRTVDLRTRVVAGSFAAGGVPEGAHLFRVSLDAVRSVDRIAFARSRSFALDLGVERFVDGRVLDRDGEPVAGAEVDVGERRAGLLQVVETDPDGRFSIATLDGPGIPLIVRAEGHADAYVRVDVAARMEPIEVRLLAGGSALVRCVSPLPDLQRLRLHLRPVEGRRSLTAYPFFRSVDRPIEVGEDGIGRLRGLPARGEFELVGEHPLLPEGFVRRFELRDGFADLRVTWPPVTAGLTVEIGSSPEGDSGIDSGTGRETGLEVVRAGQSPRRGLLAPAAASPGLVRFGAADSFRGALGRVWTDLPEGLRLRFELSGGQIERVQFPSGLPTRKPLRVGSPSGETLAELDPGIWLLRRDGRELRVLLLGDLEWPAL